MEKQHFSDTYRRIFLENHLEDYTSDATIDKMYQMTEHMLAVNSHTNLTAITDPEAVILKHLADSCTVLSHIPEGATVCDVGCGGGFPSLPMAIARPDLTVVGLDSTGKKVDYINASAALLGLENLSAVCGRAEALGQEALRESFDAVTARAVAALPTLAELCLPLLRVGGLFCAMKGSPEEAELRAAEIAMKTLGAPLTAESLHQLTLGEERRTIIATKKTEHTPKIYPRSFGQIKKKPLGT